VIFPSLKRSSILFFDSGLFILFTVDAGVDLC
jgi:hypothetical protein